MGKVHKAVLIRGFYDVESDYFQMLPIALSVGGRSKALDLVLSHGTDHLIKLKT